MCVKLVSGRVTFVLQRLWPALLSVAQSSEPWQLELLSADDRALLDLVNAVGSVRLDELPGSAKRLRESARLLERRLLVHTSELHTESGAHTKVLDSWESWSAEHWPDGRQLPLAEAKSTLESAVSALNAHFRAKALLPWQAARSAP